MNPSEYLQIIKDEPWQAGKEILAALAIFFIFWAALFIGLGE